MSYSEISLIRFLVQSQFEEISVSFSDEDARNEAEDVWVWSPITRADSSAARDLDVIQIRFLEPLGKLMNPSHSRGRHLGVFRVTLVNRFFESLTASLTSQ